MGILNSLKDAITAPSIADEHYYEIVAGEIARGEMSPGLWAKAQVDAEFEDSKSKARYVRLRVESLKVAATQAKTAVADFTNACKFLDLGQYQYAIHGNVFYPRGLLFLAKNGHSLAQVKLGNIYEYGQGVTASMASALHYYRKAAALGNAWAMYNLARVSYTKDDFEDASNWYWSAKRSCSDSDVELRKKLSEVVPWIAYLLRTQTKSLPESSA